LTVERWEAPMHRNQPGETELSTNQARLLLDAGRELKVSHSQLWRVDYGYASTSHATQGATVDRVNVNVD
jgi:hypothetical protein